MEEVLRQLDETVDGECDFLLDDEQMIDIYGPRHSSEPSQFKFELGDRKQIRKLVSYVKEIVDGVGKLQGLKHFEVKKKKRKIKPLLSIAKRNRPPNKRATSQSNESVDTLHSKLFKRVEDYMKELNVDTARLEKSMIVVDPNGLHGKIHCVLCKNKTNKKSAPKSVYYHNGTRSNYWVISNFRKHCEIAHTSITKFATQNGKKCSRSEQDTKIKVEKEIISNDDDMSLATLKTELQEQKSNEKSLNESIDKSIEMVMIDSCSENESPAEINNNNYSYADQFYTQVKKMVGNVMMNGDNPQQMAFQLPYDIIRYLSVVVTKPDGNCLFSALTHQLFGNPINNKEHVNKMIQLRAAVVAHILLEENFSLYQFTLQDRLFEITKEKKSNIPDISKACKDYVHNYLSKPGTWGGEETLRAVANMYKTNIVVFREDGEFNSYRSRDNMYKRSILIAYRRNGSEYNHYDSVTDMDQDSIEAVANAMPKD